MPALRAKRPADSDLRDAAVHGVRGHAVQTQRRNHERQDPEESREHRDEPFLPHRCLHVVRQEVETEGQVGIDGAYRGAHTGPELHRRAHGGPHAQADRRPPGRPGLCLRHGQVDNRLDPLPL